jgi:mono/diheme cytochrome c family protein
MVNFTSRFARLVATALYAVTLCLAGAVTASYADQDRHGMVNDMELPTDADKISAGGERFKERCAYCHLASGRGGSSGVCLACQKYRWGSKASDIYTTIAAGRRNTKMGAFGNPETGLQPEEILNIIAYIRRLQEAKLVDDEATEKQVKTN